MSEYTLHYEFDDVDVKSAIGEDSFEFLEEHGVLEAVVHDAMNAAIESLFSDELPYQANEEEEMIRDA